MVTIRGDDPSKRAQPLPRENRKPRSTLWEDIPVPNTDHNDNNDQSPRRPSSSPQPAEPRVPRSSTPPSSASIAARQLSSLLLTILLYTAATPFQPFSWLLGSVSGTFLFDRLFAGLALFACFYFQWRIASLRIASLIIHLPFPGSSGTAIRNGRVERVTLGTPVWVWRADEYWHFAACEAVVLVLAEWGPSEALRRVMVSVVVTGLWMVGWAATPEGYKRWAWQHAKAYLFWAVWDELRHFAWSAAVPATSNRRRARQARW